MLDVFKMNDLFPPLLWDGYRLVRPVIISHQRRRAGRQLLLGGCVHQRVFGGHALVAQAGDAHSDSTVGAISNRREECDFDLGHDDADIRERLTLLEQAQVQEIMDARLLEVGQVFGVVEVALRIQVAVADLDAVIKAEF